MDCCSSNYMDYRHSINNNFCYPYSPSMMRGASPYQVPPGVAGRYGADYRGGYYDGSFDKYYGSYHPAAGSGHGYGGNYYGNSYSSYREFAYNDYYHPSSPSPSSHPFAGPPPGSFHGPHMFNRHQSLPLSFQRESYYHQRDHHQYAAGFSNYSGNPYKGADSHPGSSTTSSSSGNNAPNNGSGSSSSPGSSSAVGESPLFGAQQNEYTHSPDYSAQSYNSSSSPNHPHHHRHHPHPHLSPGEGGGSSNSSYPPSAMPNATGTYI